MLCSCALFRELQHPDGSLTRGPRVSLRFSATSKRNKRACKLVKCRPVDVQEPHQPQAEAPRVKTASAAAGRRRPPATQQSGELQHTSTCGGAFSLCRVKSSSCCCCAVLLHRKGVTHLGAGPKANFSRQTRYPLGWKNCAGSHPVFSRM